jgi:IS5 family transposase
MTKKDGIIVGVMAHKEHTHDSKTLSSIIAHAHTTRTKPIKEAFCDRGYVGVKEVQQTFYNETITTTISIPKKPLKRDTSYQKQKKRQNFRRRAAIEPVIGHMKSDYRLKRNFLKGFQGDQINLLMSATAWNLKKWINLYFYAYFTHNISLQVGLVLLLQEDNHPMKIYWMKIVTSQKI